MLNVAIIGCGAVVEDLHVPPLLKLARRGALRVTALVDSQPARIEKLRREFPGARGHGSPAEAYAAGPVSLTLITSPPSLHVAHGLAAFAAMSHVFTEKPMVTTGADADRLTAAATVAKRVLAVGLPRRYFPHVAEVAALVASGELGDELTFTYREGGPYLWPVASEAPFRRAISGGGVLMDKGVHMLDTLDQLFGAAEVVRSADDSLRDGVESNARLELRYPQFNACGTLQLSWDQPLNNGLWLRGARGEIWLGLDDIGVYRRRAPGGPWREIRATATWPTTLSPRPKCATPDGYCDCMLFQWIGVLRAIQFGEAPAVDGLRATRVIRAIESAYRQTEPLDLPWLSTPERAALKANHWRAAA